MDGLSAAAILKAVASYGVLGLGWVAWILTMFYVNLERKRYQALVIHIIQHFTKVQMPGDTEGVLTPGDNHHKTFTKLFGKGTTP